MSDTKKNRELLQHIMQQFATTGSPAALIDNLTEDASLELTIPEGTPLSGKFKGREGFVEYFKRVDETVEISDVAMTDYLAEGDKVVILGHETLRVKRSNAVYSTHYAAVCTLTAGRIARFLIIEDLSPIAQAYR
jgi:ketosteroid isomerase-like protein